MHFLEQCFSCFRKSEFSSSMKEQTSSKWWVTFLPSPHSFPYPGLFFFIYSLLESIKVFQNYSPGRILWRNLNLYGVRFLNILWCNYTTRHKKVPGRITVGELPRELAIEWREDSFLLYTHTHTHQIWNQKNNIHAGVYLLSLASPWTSLLISQHMFSYMTGRYLISGGYWLCQMKSHENTLPTVKESMIKMLVLPV